MAPANPTPSHPSVFILKSQDSSGTTACLAKDFYPKEVKISMNPGSPVLYERAEPVLTARRKYGAIKIVNTTLNEDVHCSVQHNNQKIDRTLASEKQPDFSTLAHTASVTEACRTSDSSLQDKHFVHHYFGAETVANKEHRSEHDYGNQMHHVLSLEGANQ
ncbi:hypothetical protein Y1Q_0007742 [Alligator mississippiensis]|uniref:Immunoglobulin C1-set domain-containing protein n=1 Tax=Alligator mississippiensis TaxID=8496 RepID=A0A151NBW2_ALLMI|nr:hypothetical protein Y1Q_0007742 [Alligator mississippiensis]